MRAAVIVARELLRCRMLDSGRDALLEQVTELLDAACRGATLFCTLPTVHAVVGARAHPQHNRALPPRGPEEPLDADWPRGAARATLNAPSARGCSKRHHQGRVGVQAPVQ